MKKFFIILLSLVLIAVPVLATAQPRYEAQFFFNVEINGISINTDKPVIYLAESDTIDISLNLKTNEDFFAGPLSTEIIYTEGSLYYNNFNWNTNGRFYSCCKTYSNFESRSDAENYFKLNMIPTSSDCSVAPSLLNEALVDMNFLTAGSNGDTAEIYIDENTLRTNDNPFGSMYFACYTDNGSFTGNRYDYGNELSIDLSKAHIKFKVTDVGDVDGDGVFSASDALSLIQCSTGLKDFTSTQNEKGDIDKDGSVTAADALSVLQLSTGLVCLDNILNK